MDRMAPAREADHRTRHRAALDADPAVSAGMLAFSSALGWLLMAGSVKGRSPRTGAPVVRKACREECNRALCVHTDERAPQLYLARTICAEACAQVCREATAVRSVPDVRREPTENHGAQSSVCLVYSTRDRQPVRKGCADSGGRPLTTAHGGGGVRAHSYADI